MTSSTRSNVQLGTQPKNRRSTPAGGDSIYAEESERLMEQQNNDTVNLLSEQVEKLKHISLDIKRGISEDQKLLNNMDEDFGSTQGFMAGTLGRLNTMLTSGSSKHMCYLAGFIFCFFMIVYWMMRK